MNWLEQLHSDIDHVCEIEDDREPWAMELATRLSEACDQYAPSAPKPKVRHSILTEGTIEIGWTWHKQHRVLVFFVEQTRVHVPPPEKTTEGKFRSHEINPGAERIDALVQGFFEGYSPGKSG